MPRKLTTTTLSFGLVSIHVGLYPVNATSKKVKNKMLDAQDKMPVRQQYVSHDGRVLSRDDIVKGVEWAKGEYVVLTADERESLRLEATDQYTIETFLPHDAVQPVMLGSAYWLKAEQGAQRAYDVLAEVLDRTQRIAIGRYILKGVEHAAVLRTNGYGLELQHVRWKEETNAACDVYDSSPRDVAERELTLALRYVEQHSGLGMPAYKSEHREAVLEAIEAKMRDGRAVAYSMAGITAPTNKDLCQSLMDSLNRGS